MVAPKAGAAARGQGEAQPQSAPGDASVTVGLSATTWGAHDIDLRTSVLDTKDGALEITVNWGDGTSETFAVDARAYGGDSRTTRHRYPGVGIFGVTVTAKDTTNGVEASNQVAVTTGGAEFTPHRPTRVLDTRDGTGYSRAKVPARTTVALKITSAGQVPAGATAVAMNVTVTGTTGPGHISVESEKALAESAETSNLNFVAGQTVPNLVLSRLDDNGFVYLFNAGWEPVDLIADITGYFAPARAAGYRAVPQTRAVDTREGLGTARGQVAGGNSFDVQIAGATGVPAGATAVALNLTVTNPQEAGHLTAYPAGQGVPNASNVNFTAGQTVANAVIVPIGKDGKISVRNGSWRPADVVVDVVGYYTPDSRAAFVPTWVPFRIVDSRKTSWGRPAGPLPARSYFAMRLESDTTTPEVDGWALNTTVTNTGGPGFLSVTPDPNFWSDYQNGTALTPPRPVSSTLNWTAGATVPNVAQTPGGKGGIVDIWNQGWQDTDFMVDLLGYYQSS
ncbi:hypothetical protein AB0K51_00850 [Kitasatospora sp. NPDC049285]|uniref:hypothetical protein n=1 Tax=Kitasatospora sp. NPDC049285 TaxID=3157096 RepID=UPI00341DC65E